MKTSVIKEEDIKKGGAYNVRDALKPLTGLNVMEAGMTGTRSPFAAWEPRPPSFLLAANALPERIREVP